MPTFDYLATLAALKGKRVLVTGGCGFLGRNLVEMLLDCGAKVDVFDLFITEEYDPRVKFIKGNLLSDEELSAAVQGKDVVIHVASPAPTSNNPKLFNAVNIGGTGKVIEMCVRHGVGSLVYTSSASVQYDGTDQRNHDEDTPLPAESWDPYTYSKLEAEKLVLQAGLEKRLATCAIRPHGIFGPGDRHFVPALAKVGKAGKSRYIVGNGLNVADWTFVKNVAYGHLLAAVHLTKKSPLCGQAYFITNKEPMLFWDMMSNVHRGLGNSLPWLKLPFGMMLGVAFVAKIFTEALKRPKPTFTKQSVSYAGTDHWYSSAKATRDFGYRPAFSVEEGVRETIASFQHLRHPKPTKYPEPNFGPRRTGPLGFRSTSRLLSVVLVLAFVAALVSGAVDQPWQRVCSSWWGWLALALVSVELVKELATISRDFFKRVKPFTETPDLSGRLALITGANKGVGFHTAVRFAQLGANVIILCRNEQRAQKAVQEIRKHARNKKQEIEYMLVDLTKMATVRNFVGEYDRRGLPQADWLINNAGAMLSKATTEDGFDAQVAANHLGHFLLTTMMIDRELLTDTARIVCVSSHTHLDGHVNFDDLHYTKGSYAKFNVYCDTKLMNVMFAFELQRRLKRRASDQCAIAVHPGSVATDFVLHFIPRWLYTIASPIINLITVPADHGTHTTMYAAVSREMQGAGGLYLDNCNVGDVNPEAKDPRITERLWNVSAAAVDYEPKSLD